MPDAASFEAEALSRLPLAEAVLGAARHVLDPAFCADFAARHGADGYPNRVGFAEFVGLVGDALVRHGGSLNAAHAEAEAPSASRQAVYAKLRRVPPPLSVDWLRECSARVARLAAGPAEQLHPCFDGLDVLVMDGKALKRAAKRLKPCRGAPGKLLGGKLLVAWRPRSGLAVAMAADPDGQANECRLVPELLAQFPEGEGRLWVADRQFGDLAQPGRVLGRGAHFLVRLGGKTGFAPDPSRPASAGSDAAGRPFAESWGRLGAAGRGPEARRVALELGGGESLVVATDLLDAEEYPAEALLGLYRRRWGIERAFQEVTEQFGLARLIGSSPGAAVFQAAHCLVVHALIQVVKGHAAAAGGVPPAEASGANLFKDVREELTAGFKVLGAARLAESVRPLASAAELAARMAGTWRERWRKSPPGKPRPPRKRAKEFGGHRSVHRLILQHRKTQT